VWYAGAPANHDRWMSLLTERLLLSSFTNRKNLMTGEVTVTSDTYDCADPGVKIRSSCCCDKGHCAACSSRTARATCTTTTFGQPQNARLGDQRQCGSPIHRDGFLVGHRLSLVVGTACPRVEASGSWSV